MDSLGAASEPVAQALEVKEPGFTDPSLMPLHTFVKALHINELRDRIDTNRVFYGMGRFDWSPAPVAGETGLAGWRDHVLELRQAAEEVLSDTDAELPAWVELPVNCPQAAAMEELRKIVQTL